MLISIGDFCKSHDKIVAVAARSERIGRLDGYDHGLVHSVAFARAQPPDGPLGHRALALLELQQTVAALALLLRFRMSPQDQIRQRASLCCPRSGPST
jgi:hypothetical protein